MVCMLGENKDIEVPKSLQVTKKEEMMGDINSISGPSEELKTFALELIETSSKYCVGIPYKSS